MDAELGTDPATELGQRLAQSMQDAVQLLWWLEEVKLRQAAQAEAMAIARARREQATRQDRPDGPDRPRTKQDVANDWASAVLRGDDSAAARVEQELRKQAPESMKRYDDARNHGVGRVDAMRHVARDVDQEMDRFHTTYQATHQATHQAGGRSAGRSAGQAPRPPRPGRPTGPRATAQQAAEWSRGASPRRRPGQQGPGQQGPARSGPGGPGWVPPATWSRGHGVLRVVAVQWIRPPHAPPPPTPTDRRQHRQPQGRRR